MNNNKERFTSRVAVYLVLIKNNQILLNLRKNTGFADGLYGLASGHLEDGETIRQAMIREAEEETGIIINPDDLKLVHVAQHKSNNHYVDFYFQCDSYAKEPVNCEPEKCGDVRFFPLNKLPDNFCGNVRQALEYIKHGSYYSEYGFEPS